MKEDSKLWCFLFREGASKKEAIASIVVNCIILICGLLFIPIGSDKSLYSEIKQKIAEYKSASCEKQDQKDVLAPIDGYSFVKLYHLVVADTKKDQAYYYGQTAAIFKGENDYLLCYKADEEIKKIPFKNWSDGSCKGVIVEDAKIIRFSGVYPDKDGCEFNYVKDGAFCESYFWRKM